MALYVATDLTLSKGGIGLTLLEASLMQRTTLATALLCSVALTSGMQRARSQTSLVDVSLNVFPTNLANPADGGLWTLVAKTDAPFGIAAINLYLINIDAESVGMAGDINGELRESGKPFVHDFPPVNAIYFQNSFEDGVIPGVGTLATSDGPDPLGDPTWDDATEIFFGTYSGALPEFTSSRGNVSDANVWGVGAPPFNNAFDADFHATVRGVVRVQAIPEPSSALAATAFVALFPRGLRASRRRTT